MKMSELAPVIRSKNAGPYWFTVDIIFDSLAIYNAVKKFKCHKQGGNCQNI